MQFTRPVITLPAGNYFADISLRYSNFEPKVRTSPDSGSLTGLLDSEAAARFCERREIERGKKKENAPKIIFATRREESL
jgi:hypothetical protein